MVSNSRRSFLDYLLLSVKGFCMGAADVVPGVSGGTMAFILGIYEELITAIRSFDVTSLQLLGRLEFRAFQEHVCWRFLLALGIGILTAIFSLARALAWLLQNHPVLIWSFFFGLILASVVTVSKGVKTWHLSTFAWALGGAAGAYFLVGIVPVSTPDAPWFLLLSGALAICAMILPGISGSFVLVLLGKYEFVLEAINQRDFLVLALVAAGAVVGITAFSRFLGWLFRRYHDTTIAVLTGLMVGSLRKIWPWKETWGSFQTNVLPTHVDNQLLASFCLMALGLIVVLILDRMGGQGRTS